MAVAARQHFRRMRGGACAHLLLAGDNHYYVVKFRNNPQHARVLVNELISYILLDYLQLPVPRWEIVEVSPEFVAENPDLCVEIGRRKQPCEPGRHFGSRYPGDPARMPVYDYVPWAILKNVLNRPAFRGMAAFDKWVSNANGRQAIFFRDRAKKWLPAAEAAPVSPRSLAFVANMVDHGFAFNAQHWDFSDSPERGLYTRREIYEDVTGYESFEPWLDRIRNCSADVLDDAYKKIPPEWHGHDWDALELLLERLYRRRELVPDLLRAAKDAARDPFPNWRPAPLASRTAARREQNEP